MSSLKIICGQKGPSKITETLLVFIAKFTLVKKKKNHGEIHTAAFIHNAILNMYAVRTLISSFGDLEKRHAITLHI